jgi:hypothetical protein
MKTTRGQNRILRQDSCLACALSWELETGAAATKQINPKQKIELACFWVSSRKSSALTGHGGLNEGTKKSRAPAGELKEGKNSILRHQLKIGGKWTAHTRCKNWFFHWESTRLQPIHGGHCPPSLIWFVGNLNLVHDTLSIILRNVKCKWRSGKVAHPSRVLFICPSKRLKYYNTTRV